MSTQIRISKNGTTTLATAGKYCDRNIAIHVDVPTSMQVHKITVESDLTSGTNTLLADNDFIKNHYTDAGFMLLLISLQTHTEGYAIGYAYNSNRQLFEYGDNLWTGLQANLTTADTVNIRTALNGCTAANNNGVPYVDSTGNVLIRNNTTSGTLKAGEYLLVLSVVRG